MSEVPTFGRVVIHSLGKVAKFLGKWFTPDPRFGPPPNFLPKTGLNLAKWLNSLRVTYVA